MVCILNACPLFMAAMMRHTCTYMYMHMFCITLYKYTLYRAAPTADPTDINTPPVLADPNPST